MSRRVCLTSIWAALALSAATAPAVAASAPSLAGEYDGTYECFGSLPTLPAHVSIDAQGNGDLVLGGGPSMIEGALNPRGSFSLRASSNADGSVALIPTGWKERLNGMIMAPMHLQRTATGLFGTIQHPDCRNIRLVGPRPPQIPSGSADPLLKYVDASVWIDDGEPGRTESSEAMYACYVKYVGRPYRNFVRLNAEKIGNLSPNKARSVVTAWLGGRDLPSSCPLNEAGDYNALKLMVRLWAAGGPGAR